MHRPKLGPFIDTLTTLLKHDQPLPLKQRRTAQGYYEALQAEGYRGAYDSVRRFVKHWRAEHQGSPTDAYIPLVFEPGEAFQFDWSHEKIVIAGAMTDVKIAHIRLCHSRLFLTVAYLRESQEMVFDAHRSAFEFFGGVTRRGIYDNMKTAVCRMLRPGDGVAPHGCGQIAAQARFRPQFDALALLGVGLIGRFDLGVALFVLEGGCCRADLPLEIGRALLDRVEFGAGFVAQIILAG